MCIPLFHQLNLWKILCKVIQERGADHHLLTSFIISNENNSMKHCMPSSS